MIITMPLGIMQANCYLIYNENGGDGIVIDPGGNGAPLLKEIEKHNLSIHYILNTHGHFDHVAGNASLAILNAPLAIHSDDRELLMKGGGARWFGLDFIAGQAPDIELAEGQILTVGEMTIEVIHTPGHSPGSVCFYLPGEKLLVTGDTLFAGSIGRSDLPGGDPYVLSTSLRRMLDFPVETVIYPGHGPASTLARERRSNMWLQRLDQAPTKR